MSMQSPRVFPATITTGNSVSAGINTQGGYLYISVEVPASGATPAFATAVGSPLWIQGSLDNVTYRRLFEIYTNAVANPFSIQSSVCNAIVPVTYFNMQYIKLEISGTVTGAGGVVPYRIICTDSL